MSDRDKEDEELARKLVGPRWQEVEEYAARDGMSYLEAVMVMIHRAFSDTGESDERPV